MQSRSNKNYKAIDVYSGDGNINFNKVKDQGIDIVILKATEGVNFIDSAFNSNYTKARNVGLKIGVYHFMSERTDPVQQARDFWNCIKDKKIDLIPILDIETNKKGRSKAAITDRCLEFLKEFKALSGYDAVIYTYTSFARENMDSRLSKYKLWIAHYGVNTPGTNPIWNSWVGFQYTDKGRVNGVPGDRGYCDMDEINDGFLIGKSFKPSKPSSSTSNNSKLWEREISGEEVKALQHQINVQGYGNVKEDGYFGDSTLNACPTVKQGARGQITKLIQQRLLNRGYTSLNAHGGADGVFGSGTTTAIKNLQRNKGLSVDGIVGKDTWKALYSK